MNDNLAAIRQSVDSDELLVTSHGDAISTSRHRSFGRDQKIIPTWAKSDAEIRKILCQVFPRLAHDARQRKAAARWLRVIYLYFRIGMTRGQIVDELHTSNEAIRTILKRIRFAAAGKSRGHGHWQTRLKGAGRGRPRKIAPPVPGSFR